MLTINYEMLLLDLRMVSFTSFYLHSGEKSSKLCRLRETPPPQALGRCVQPGELEEDASTTQRITVSLRNTPCRTALRGQ
jgi:hypothetical protein